jgi:FkbM family methyltransferase
MIVDLAEAVRKRSGYRFPRLGPAAFHALFRLLPARANVELFPGIRIDLDFNDATMRSTYWQGERFEQPTIQVLDSWAGGATHFFDIGSNYGFYSYWMLSRRSEMQVHAFEPSVISFTRIEATRLANDLRRLHAWNIGLGDAVGRIELHPGVDDSGHSTFGRHPELAGRSLGEVDVLPFDDWRESHGFQLPDQPAWIAKIDVEGFETRVIRGMAKSLKARAFAGLVVEVNEFTLGFCGTSAAELRAEMRAYGYREETVSPDSGNAFFVPG